MDAMGIYELMLLCELLETQAQMAIYTGVLE